MSQQGILEVRDPEIQIFDDSSIGSILNKLELAGRVCYKSEGRIGPGTAHDLIRRVIDKGHESVLEHCSLSARFTCDRGVTHELVRHRVCSFSQESTRFCDYNGGPIQVISPWWINGEEVRTKYRLWFSAMENAAVTYKAMREAGASPQEARSVLPNSLKTEIVVTANIREWRHMFKVRCAKDAHPDFRRLMVPLLHEFDKMVPVVFTDLVGFYNLQPWMDCKISTVHMG